MPVLNLDALSVNRIDAIREYHRQAGISCAQLDVSGGVDSAVMLKLLVLALGPKNVTAAYSNINSSEESHQRAKLVAHNCMVDLIDIDLTDIFNQLVTTMVASMHEAGFNVDEIDARLEADPTILGSMRSCLRAPIGRGFNRLSGGGIRHGTGNECEDRWLRFYQKGGDGEVDTNPLGMLSKGEVYQLAWYLNLPSILISAKPTPDLWGAGNTHNDEDELLSWTGANFTYSRIDLDSGEYSCIGTIERVSRYLDYHGIYPHPLFDDLSTEDDLKFMFINAYASPSFQHIPEDEVRTLLLAARKVEHITRHKENPNIPELGDRNALLREKILTNNL